jgi:transposase-like protein
VSKLQNPIFTDEAKAREWLEARVWPHGPTCPHCGNADQEKITKLEGDAHRAGVYQCNEPQCRLQFTVTVNTVFERSKIPLTKWLAALFLMTASKKGISAHQVHSMFGISYKSTWFLMHRLREAMRPAHLPPRRLQGVPKQRGGGAHKNIVMTPVERGGSARSFHVDSTTLNEMTKIVRENVKAETIVLLREASARYLAEFDFRYSNRVKLGIDDATRANLMAKGIVGKHLTYRRPHGKGSATPN